MCFLLHTCTLKEDVVLESFIKSLASKSVIRTANATVRGRDMEVGMGLRTVTLEDEELKIPELYISVSDWLIHTSYINLCKNIH